jgi:hypothetical protein
MQNLSEVQIMKNLILLAVFFLFPLKVLACDAEAGSKYITSAPGGIVYVREIPMMSDDDSLVEDDVRLEVVFHDCSNGRLKSVGLLPYLASAGKVHAVFFTSPLGHAKNQLIVLHSAELRANTGDRFVTDFHSVQVFNLQAGRFARDDKAENYFGDGGDIVNDYDQNVIIYRYPYKTEAEVRAELASENYKKWISGEEVLFNIVGDVPIYTEPAVIYHPVGTLKSGSLLRQLDVYAGWVEVAIGNTVALPDARGWVKRDELLKVIK